MLSLDSRVFTLPGSLHSATVEMSGVGRPHKCLVLAALTSGGHPHKWWPPSQMCGGGRPHRCLVVAALTDVWWWLPSQMVAALTNGGCPHKWWLPSQMVAALTNGGRPHKCLVVAALTNVWWWLPSQMVAALTNGDRPHKWCPPSQLTPLSCATLLASYFTHPHPCRVRPPFV